MPRALSSGLVSAMLAERSSFLVLVALEIDSPEIREIMGGTPYYCVNNPENVSIDGIVYVGVGFDIQFPEHRANSSIARASITFPATTTLIRMIRAARDTIKVTVRVVSETDLTMSPPWFNQVEIEFLPLELTNVKWNDKTVKGELSFDSLAQLQYPGDEVTPFLFPGAF
jgi:hypothetical protein